MFWLRQNKIKSVLYLLVLIIFSVPVLLALFHPGFFQTDDGEWMIIRFSAFHQAFRDGEFPVRFLGRLNFGYGYPVADFLYPGFMYLAEIPKIIGLGFVDSIKIILGFSLLGSGFFFYLWLSKLFDKFSSLVGAVFYIFTPYHLYDVYIRGSVGEVLALSVVPFILWQIERKSFFWSAVGIGFLILSHNTLAVLFFPVLLLYMGLDIFIARKKSPLLYRYMSISLIGVGLAGFFFLPALFDLQYTVFSKTTVSNFNSYFSGINIIGLSVLFILFLFLVLIITGKIKLSKHRLAALLFVTGTLSLFFSSSYSAFFWNILPVSFIQFPFRLLSVGILSASFLVACCISVFMGRTKMILGIIILAIAVYSSRSYLTPQQFFDKGEGFYATNEGSTTVHDEYMPKWVLEAPQTHFDQKVVFASGSGIIRDLMFNNRSVKFFVSVDKESKISINTIYFPGWSVLIDGKSVEINHTNKRGLIQFSIPQGNHQVLANFSETPFRFFADLLSILSFIVLLGLSFLFRQPLQNS